MQAGVRCRGLVHLQVRGNSISTLSRVTVTKFPCALLLVRLKRLLCRFVELRSCWAMYVPFSPRHLVIQPVTS